MSIDPLEDFKLICFILYNEDAKLGDWIFTNNDWLAEISGTDCYNIIFENPELWTAPWREHLKDVFEREYELNYNNLLKQEASKHDLSNKLATRLDINKNSFPIVLFVNSIYSTRYLLLPIAQNIEELNDYFEKLFFIINNSIKDCEESADLDKLHSDINDNFTWLERAKLERKLVDEKEYLNKIKSMEYDRVVSIIVSVLYDIFWTH